MNTHENLCTLEQSLLVIIDQQTKLIRTLPDNDADLMLTNSGKLVKAAEHLDIPILITEQYPKGLGHTGTQLQKCFPTGTAVIEKTSFSCCGNDEFNTALRSSGRKQLILAGIEAHVCILQSAMDLTASGYQVYVIEDAVCSRKLEHKLYALQRMQQHGITISCYESILFEWLKDAKHEQFKSISALI